jgi:hypothetical protein
MRPPRDSTKIFFTCNSEIIKRAISERPSQNQTAVTKLADVVEVVKLML